MSTYSGLSPAGNEARRCGAPESIAAFAIVAAVGGAVAWSVTMSGYDTGEYNWVDDWRVGIPRGMGVLLGLLYGQAALYNHLAFADCSLFARPCAHPASTEAKEEIWARTPSEARGAAVSCGGWAVCFAILLFSMTFFEPGCQRGLCICVMLCMAWWNICWYGAMLGRVDVDDERKLPASNWFFAETIQEIIIVCVCGYFAFFAKGVARTPEHSGTAVECVRVWFLRFIGALLTLLYGTATLFKHTMFVKDLAKPLIVEGKDPADVWRNTPTVSKHSAVSSGGWCVCVSLTILGMTFLEPGCERGLCKSFALCMLWWNCVWYGAMLNRVDFNDSCKRPWANWFKAETVQEIILFLVAGYLGFFAK